MAEGCRLGGEESSGGRKVWRGMWMQKVKRGDLDCSRHLLRKRLCLQLQLWVALESDERNWGLSGLQSDSRYEGANLCAR
jgi:hypothetical protein